MTLCGCLGHLDVIKYYFRYLLWAICDDVQLCNRCVREFLILACTWFAFGLASKIGFDKCSADRRIAWGLCYSWYVCEKERGLSSYSSRVGPYWGDVFPTRKSMICRGENGQGTRNGYRIRVLIRDHFSDTDTGIFIFGTDTGNTRIVQFRIRVGYGASTTR
jgi:hypothetical protein